MSFSAPDASGEQTETFDGAVIATTARPAMAMFPQMDENHRALYETHAIAVSSPSRSG